MVTATPTPLFPCSRLCRPPRHIHESLDLQATGLACPCGAVAWAVMFGALVPAAVCCLACGRQADLEQLLRRCGRGRQR